MGSATPGFAVNVFTPAAVSGGTHTEDADYHYYAFTSSGSLAVLRAGRVDALLVGGGGGGGQQSGGGGGGGEVFVVEDMQVEIGSLSVVVGAGGAGAPASFNTRPGSGEPTSFNGAVAAGGGNGGWARASDATTATEAAQTGGGSGASGGGGCIRNTREGGHAVGGGNPGGTSRTGNTAGTGAGGGGGGAGSAGGSPGATNVAGAGGNGRDLSAEWAAWGASGFFGGGGGGGSVNGGTAGTGVHGGGNGGSGATASAATANTGSGGGGGGNNGSTPFAGGNGGSGLVVVRVSKSPTGPIAATLLERYIALIQSANPVAYWPMDDASGLPQDISGNGRHMTAVSGSPTYEQAGPFAGSIAEAIEYPSTAYHERSVVSAATTGFTVEFWARRSGNTSGDLFRHGTTSGGFEIEFTDTAGTFRVNVTGVGTLGTQDELFVDNAWTHVAITRGAASWYGYVNGRGEPVGSASPATPVGNTRIIGGAASGVRIAHLAYYDSALEGRKVALRYLIAAGEV